MENEVVEAKDLNDSALDQRIAELGRDDGDATPSTGPVDGPGTPASTEADPNASQGTQGAAPSGEPAKGNAQPNADPNAQTALLAGKYKTPDDLAKGIGEIGKALNLPDYLLAERIEQAKATGNWKPVEEIYKKLDADLTRKREAEKAAATPTSQPAATTLSAEDIQRIKSETAERFNSELADHPIMRDLAQAGVEFPITKETIEALKGQNYGLYAELRRAIGEVQSKLESEATGYAEALKGAEPAMAKARTEGSEYLAKLNSEYELGYNEDELKTMVESALSDKALMEEKYGVVYPIEKAVTRHFWSNHNEDALKRATTSAKVKGRTEHTEDLKTMHSKTTATASRASLPGSQNRAGVKIDPTNRADVAGLADAELDERLKELASE